MTGVQTCALPIYRKENVELFKRLKIYTAEEVRARKEILLENYCKVISIEALTMCQITQKQILPAAVEFSTALAKNIKALNELGMETSAQADMLRTVSGLVTSAYRAQQRLSEAQLEIKNEHDLQSAADFCHDNVFALMQELRAYCDDLETLLPKDRWPFPTYGDLLLYV